MGKGVRCYVGRELCLPLVVARRGEIRKNKISYVFSYSLAQLRALGESILCYFLAFPKK